jgi:hypothetical protein
MKKRWQNELLDERVFAKCHFYSVIVPDDNILYFCVALTKREAQNIPDIICEDMRVILMFRLHAKREQSISCNNKCNRNTLDSCKHESFLLAIVLLQSEILWPNAGKSHFMFSAVGNRLQIFLLKRLKYL